MLKQCTNCNNSYTDSNICCCDMLNVCVDHDKWETMKDRNVSKTDSKHVKKADFGKVDMSLLEYFPLALEAVCRPSEFGCTKYERGSFADVPNARRRYTAAMLRHLFKEGDGEVPNIDEESGLEHDLMTAWNAMVRLELRLRGYKFTESNK